MRSAKGDATTPGDFNRAKGIIRMFAGVFDEANFVSLMKRISSKIKSQLIQSQLATLLTLMDQSSPGVKNHAKKLTKLVGDARRNLDAASKLPAIISHIEKLSAAVDAAKAHPKANKLKSCASLETTYLSLKAACQSTAPLSSESVTSILSLFEAFVEANERFWREEGHIKRAWKGPLAKHRESAESGLHELLACLVVARKLDLLLERLEMLASGTQEQTDPSVRSIFRKRTPACDAAVTICGVRREHAGAPFIEMVNERVRRYSEAVEATADLPSPWAELSQLEMVHETLAATAGIGPAEIDEMKRINDELMRDVKELRAKTARAEKQLLC